MIEERISFSLHLNGEDQPPMDLPGHWRLLDYLHEVKGLTGTKLGCGAGFCKACTVCARDLDGRLRAIPACSTSLKVCNGWSIVTVEFLGQQGQLHPLQTAVVEHDAFQCGYCTPGFLMEAYALHENLVQLRVGPARAESMLGDVLEGHLCRCTGYGRYVEALGGVIRTRATEALDAAEPARADPESPTQLITHPRWELVRLLHEAAQVEVTLMLQYLYAAFSLRMPAYTSLVGFGHRSPGMPLDFLAVAIEEMSHLDTVNRLLVALGARPTLLRQDLPWEPAIYPFQLSMEPLSRRSLCKYLYVEANSTAIQADARVKAIVERELDMSVPLNRVGSLYGRILGTLDEARALRPDDLDWSLWRHKLELVRAEGEDDHYHFFRSVLLGEHPGFHGLAEPWDLPRQHHLYPVVHDLVNPTAFPGFPETLVDPLARDLAMLGNRQSWLAMGLLELSYYRGGRYHPAARRHMAGPLLQLCQHLPAEHGVPVPFDASPLDSHPGLGEHSQCDWLVALLRDIRSEERRLMAHLPPAYVESSRETLAELETVLGNG